MISMEKNVTTSIALSNCKSQCQLKLKKKQKIVINGKKIGKFDDKNSKSRNIVNIAGRKIKKISSNKV